MEHNALRLRVPSFAERFAGNRELVDLEERICFCSFAELKIIGFPYLIVAMELVMSKEG